MGKEWGKNGEGTGKEWGRNVFEEWGLYGEVNGERKGKEGMLCVCVCGVVEKCCVHCVCVHERVLCCVFVQHCALCLHNTNTNTHTHSVVVCCCSQTGLTHTQTCVVCATLTQLCVVAVVLLHTNTHTMKHTCYILNTHAHCVVE